MARRILILNGHPDPAGGHFDHALADAYQKAAVAAGHRVERIDVGTLDVPILRSKRAFEEEAPPPVIADAQAAIARAEHLVILYPLWLGTMPGLLKLFLEQVLRPNFAFDYRAKGLPRKRLTGRSARIVVTMGMPALAYRLFYGAHSLRSLKRNILHFVGITPVAATLIGSVETLGEAGRARWLAKLEALGRKGA
jgi:putative NADPH-quinone reductase